MRPKTKMRQSLDKAKSRLKRKIEKYFEHRRTENFLLSNLDWNKVSPVEVGKFLGFDVKHIPEDTNSWS